MRRSLLTFLYLSALAGGIYSAFRPTFDSDLARAQTETGDSMLNHYMLEHSWRAVSDPAYCGSLLAPPFFHPAPAVYWYSETLLGFAPLYWGLRLAMHHDLAFQWWQIIGTGLNFIGFAVVARWLRCSHPAAILGAFFWAFATSHVNQAMHQQLIPRFWMPLAVYHAWNLATGPNLRSLNRLLACTFLQAVTCVYTGWFLTGGLAVFLLAAVSFNPRGWRAVNGFLRTNRGKIAFLAAGWAFAFSAFFAPYVLANRGASRQYGECIAFLPGLPAWLTGPEGSRWHDSLQPLLPAVDDECYLFNGFAFYGLVLAAMVHLGMRRKSLRGRRLILAAACLATAAVWYLLTFNFYQGISAWWLVRFLPGGGAIRCVSRVSLVVDLFAVLGAMLWLDVILQGIRDYRTRTLSFGLVAAAIVFEQTGFVPESFDKSEFYPTVDRYAESIRGADAAFIVPLRTDAPLYTDILAMWAGLEANVPVVNGYSGRRPPDYPYNFDALLSTYSDEMLADWLTGRFRGRVAIVDPNRADQVRFLQIE